MAVLNYRENVDAPWQKLVVSSITMPGEGSLPEEALTISGDCSYRFAQGGWDWFVEGYGDKVTTKDITNCNNMFTSSKLTEIPFEINGKAGASINCSYMFDTMQNLTSIPKMNSIRVSDTSYMFCGCWNLRHLPEDLESYFDWSYMESQTSSYSGSASGAFSACYSLHSIPMSFLAHANPNSYYGYSYFSYGFNGCYVLDELVDLPIPYITAWTSNGFSGSLASTSRLKNLTFALKDGSPYVMNWKSQTIDLSSYVGYARYANNILNYNSGITADKRVTDDATYQALKDNPDWFTTDIAYSRYNHDSAVATINSLPDTSAYLATAGGTNTIKFKGAAGSATDGGAINTLTEEEIAVAAAKGWTVSFV